MEQCVATIRPGIAPVHYFRGRSGEPALYLHHLAGMQGWEPAMAELASRFDVIAPYRPGWGPSEGLDQMKTGLDLVLHYIDFLDHLEMERTNVLGHSVGVWIAAEMAAIRPGRVKRLVLANPVGIWDDEIQGEDPFAQSPMAATAVMFGDPKRRENLLVRDGQVDPLENYLQEMKDLKAAAKFLWPIPDTGIARRLPRITARTLVVTCADDRVVPPAYGAIWRDHLQHAESKTINNAGHLVNLEQPNRFATVAGGWFMQG